jgi:hypothetical protein
MPDAERSDSKGLFPRKSTKKVCAYAKALTLLPAGRRTSSRINVWPCGRPERRGGVFQNQKGRLPRRSAAIYKGIEEGVPPRGGRDLEESGREAGGRQERGEGGAPEVSLVNENHPRGAHHCQNGWEGLNLTCLRCW